MVTTLPSCRTINQEKNSVLFSNISYLTSSQVHPQEIMASPVDGIQYPYLANIDLYKYEHLKIYKKSIVGIPESYRYDLTRYKLTKFYQELEDDVCTFIFKSNVLIVIDRDTDHAPIYSKNIILSYQAITQIMVDSHCEILWA